LNSKHHLNRISVSDESDDEILFEGELGELHKIEFIEGTMLQICGENGVFRIDLTERELFKCLSKEVYAPR
jgi:hypothetical protein